MADKPGTMFGLSEPREGSGSSASPSSAPTAAPTGATTAPQVVYVQAPPPAAAPATGSSLRWMVGLLLVLSLVNLILVLYGRNELKTTASKQADQLDLLTRRMDTSDERYAQLRGQFQVTSEKLGLTEQELTRAHALADRHSEETANCRSGTERCHCPESQRRRGQQGSGRRQHQDWRAIYRPGGYPQRFGHHQVRIR